MSEISVCYSGNRRVFPGLLLSVLSLVRHTDRPLHVFVLSMDLRGEDPAFLPFSQAQQDLLGRVWGDTDASENSVEAYVSFLRKKLAHIGSSVQITTLRMLGYRLEVLEA